jgi:ABC-type sugar transport system substrate-binding protein
MFVVSLLPACAPAQPAPAQPAVEQPAATTPPKPVDTAPAAAQAPMKKIKIGYIVKTLGNTFWQTYQAGALAAGKDLGVEVDVRDVPTEGDFKGQLDVALAMVNQDYDAIVAASITNSNLIPAIAKANEKNIPWIVVSEDQDQAVLDQNKAYVTAKVRLSFYDEGVFTGQYVADKLGGKGEVGIVEGMAGTSATRDRIQGVKDVFQKYPDIKIVSSQPADWMREKAFDVSSAMIQANPNINAIIANNDTMALGVAKAVEQAGKKGKIIVTGDDGTPEAYDAIKNGSLSATIDGVAWQIAYYSVHAAVKAVVEKAKTLPNYDLKPNLVTPENVAEVMASAPKPPAAMFELNKNIYLPIPGITK